MRLIDADALKAQIQIEIDRYYDDVGGGIHTAMEARDEIDNAPTVDAIPVEWIQNYINKANDTDGYAVANMLEEWERGHETD